MRYLSRGESFGVSICFFWTFIGNLDYLIVPPRIFLPHSSDFMIVLLKSFIGEMVRGMFIVSFNYCWLLDFCNIYYWRLSSYLGSSFIIFLTRLLELIFINENLQKSLPDLFDLLVKYGSLRFSLKSSLIIETSSSSG